MARDFTNPVQYIVSAEDGTMSAYAVTVTVASVTSKTISGFSFVSPAAVGSINEEAKTINVTVPYGTDITSLVPVITHTGASINPASGAAQNFTNPVQYTVSAGDGTMATYTVTVTGAHYDPEPSSPEVDDPGPSYPPGYPYGPGATSKAISGFSFTNPAAVGSINESAKTISVMVPYGTERNGLVPVITTYTGVSINPASGVAQNFTNPVQYTASAENGSTVVYTVTVTAAPGATSKAISGFSFTNPVAAGNINEEAKTISVTVPYGTERKGLVPVITHTGVSINPASGTARDFTNPVQYIVSAEDETQQHYTVTVTVRGQGGVILVNPTDAANGVLSGGGITIAKTAGTSNQTETLGVTGTFDTYKWRVDGTVKGTGNSLILNAADYNLGPHQVSLEVTLKGVPYSESGTFTVEP
jgi:hypothetical protein